MNPLWPAVLSIALTVAYTPLISDGTKELVNGFFSVGTVDEMVNVNFEISPSIQDAILVLPQDMFYGLGIDMMLPSALSFDETTKTWTYPVGSNLDILPEILVEIATLVVRLKPNEYIDATSGRLLIKPHSENDFVIKLGNPFFANDRMSVSRESTSFIEFTPNINHVELVPLPAGERLAEALEALQAQAIAGLSLSSNLRHKSRLAASRMAAACAQPFVQGGKTFCSAISQPFATVRSLCSGMSCAVSNPSKAFKTLYETAAQYLTTGKIADVAHVDLVLLGANRPSVKATVSTLPTARYNAQFGAASGIPVVDVFKVLDKVFRIKTLGKIGFINVVSGEKFQWKESIYFGDVSSKDKRTGTVSIAPNSGFVQTYPRFVLPGGVNADGSLRIRSLEKSYPKTWINIPYRLGKRALDSIVTTGHRMASITTEGIRNNQWRVAASLAFNETSGTSTTQLLIDTALDNSFMTLPKALYNQLAFILADRQIYDVDDIPQAFYLEDMPTITIFVSSYPIRITPQMYIATTENNKRILRIYPKDEPFIRLGQGVLAFHSILFDANRQQIGFKPAEKPLTR